MAEIAIIAAIAGAGISAFGQYRQQQASEAGAETQRRIAEEQAVALNRRADQERLNAGQERAVSQRKAEQQREAATNLMSKQRARFASSGGGTDGSAEFVMAETGEQGEYNAELDLWQGKERGRAHLANAYDSDTQATITRAGGDAVVQGAKNSRGATYLGMASTILAGVGKAAGSMPAGSGGGSGTQIAYDYDAGSGFQTTTRRTAPSYTYG